MSRTWRFVLDHYLVLPLGGAIAIVWSNASPLAYFKVSQALAFAVNDVGMAFVLAYVAQDVVEAAMPGGTLHPWRRAVVPVIGGIGGALAATGVYLLYVQHANEEMLARGWPIACGVDIFFCVAIARAIFRRGSAVAFLLLLALASDVVGLTAASRTFLVADVHPAAGFLIVAAVVVAAALRRRRVRSVWPYLLCSAPLSWLACYWTGLHPALGLLPIVPFFFHSARNLNASGAGHGEHRRANHFEEVFEYPVQAVVFLFGLVNAGVLLRGFGTGTWAVLTALLAGRPAGILAAVAVAVSAGLHLPRNVGWKELIVIALAASLSVTFGLFFAAAVFPDGPLLMEMRIGALGTAAGILIALAAARLLRVGRFANVPLARQALGAHLTRGPA